MKGNAQEKKMIDEIVRLVGGTENINTAMHCSTRIRFTLKEEKKADVNALETSRVFWGHSGKQDSCRSSSARKSAASMK